MTSLLDRPRLVTEGALPEDGVPDMTVISEIDEHGINTNLRVRYENDKIYTYSGTILVAVNPYHQLNIYELDMVQKYSGKKMADMPPHIFATAETTLRYLSTEGRNQSCIISGESGAGKTESTKFILQYLCAVTYSESRWAEQQILEANTVLEAFGNARTLRNDNSSRFGKFIQVCFDSKEHISGCIIQDYLLELSRISFQAHGERNYHVFYQMIAAAMASPDLRQDMLLEPATTFQYLNQSGCYTLDGVDDREMFDELCLALQVLHVSPDLVMGIFRVLSALLWIGNLQFQDSEQETCQLKQQDKHIIKKVAFLLGLEEKMVRRVCTTREINVRGTVTDITLKHHEALENRHAMAKALYSRTFSWLVNQINSCTNPGTDNSRFIGVLDIFGFEKFEDNSLEQLCINYTNEKLHKFFNHYVFALEQQVYKEEGIQYSHITFTDNSICLELLEKPPKSILRLLDEECRFPRGTDLSYLEKLYHEVGRHPFFLKSQDKRRWGLEFGIQHYAGAVVYKSNGFLDKNKDVRQEMFFDFMEKSSSVFVREIAKFRNMLSVYLELAKSRTTKSKNLISGTKTTKGMPTVGDTFRTQLLALVDTLDSTTPWYIRCLKPNNEKMSSTYDDELVITQLRYSGMLDIVRIRREGYPVHVRAKDFLEKYRCLAQEELPSNEKKAVSHIMHALKVPETEWQIGKTKVFLRYTVFEPLEERRKALLTVKVVTIQRVWKGYRMRKRFQALKTATLIIQKYYRGRRQRIQFLRKRRAAIIIQAHLRGMFAREIVEEIRRKKREEEERLARLRKEEEARQERMRMEEAARIKHEEEQRKMDEAYKAAQRELITLAHMAKRKSAKATMASGDVNLDEMFHFLSDTPKASDAEEKKFLDDFTRGLDHMFQTSEGMTAPIKRLSRPFPKQPLPAMKAAAATDVVATDVVATDVVAAEPRGERASRAQRRQRRVMKKLLVMDDEYAHAEEPFNPAAYPLVKFAEMYFNDFPSDTSGFSTLSLRRAPRVQNAIPKEEMLTYSKSHSLPTSMVHMHDPDNVNLACNIFKDISKLLRGESKVEQTNVIIQSTIAYGLDRHELRDEIIVQLIRLVSNNPSKESVLKGWHIITLCVVAFPPSKNFNKYLQAYFHTKSCDPVIGRYAAACLRTMRLTKSSARRLPPSCIEIAAMKNLSPLICRFYFLDGTAKAMGVEPSAVAADVIKMLAQKIELQSTDGWALYETNPDWDHFIKSHEYIADVLSQWERDKRSSMRMTHYTTVSRKPSYTTALGGGDSRFVFRKRVFRHPKEIPPDPVEYHLMYAQATHSVVKLDEFPMNEAVALQLAGLQAQVLWGQFDSALMSRYDEINQYLPARITSSNKTRTPDEWRKQIAEAHEMYGTGKNDIQAKVWYLTAVKHYQLYGYQLFPVTYKGFWSHPNSILLAVGVDGVKFVNQKSKQTMAEYQYMQLKSLAVDILEDAITLEMSVPSEEAQQKFNFDTQPGQKEDIANLIASYAPAHQNWQKVGEAKTKSQHVTKEDKMKRWTEVHAYRRVLVEQGMLRRPEERASGFLTTTLRRVTRARINQLAQTALEKDYDKLFKRSYWSYSKSMMRQPLTVRVGPGEDDFDETCLKLFCSILQHAGSSGFEDIDPEDIVTLVQIVIQKCLEKEAVCNEFYLQLIKQTTEQPDPNSRINTQNWRLLSLICGVVVPRNKAILSYLQAHLRRCSTDSESEENHFAQFCLQCMSRTLEAKNRKYPPSQREIQCVIRRRSIHERFYFMDQQFRALEFDSVASTEEVVELVKERIGLKKSASGFSLYEVFGPLERNMLLNEKVADAMFKWEKYARSTHSQKTLKLTFKKRLFLQPFFNREDVVEFNLLLHQAIDDVTSDRFPVTLSEAIYLAGLRAQATLHNYHDDIELSDYSAIIEQAIPKRLHLRVHPEDIQYKHREYSDLTEQECNEAYMTFIQQWPLYGSTVFEVIQAYTTTLPKNLWLAVNETGIHILKRRDKEPLVTYEYKNIVNYSPSLKNLMIVTESVTRGTKFVFNTSQASQIAHLIRDYTHVIVERQRKSGSSKWTFI